MGGANKHDMVIGKCIMLHWTQIVFLFAALSRAEEQHANCEEELGHGRVFGHSFSPQSWWRWYCRGLVHHLCNQKIHSSYTADLLKSNQQRFKSYAPNRNDAAETTRKFGARLVIRFCYAYPIPHTDHVSLSFESKLVRWACELQIWNRPEASSLVLSPRPLPIPSFLPFDFLNTQNGV